MLMTFPRIACQTAFSYVLLSYQWSNMAFCEDLSIIRCKWDFGLTAGS